MEKFYLGQCPEKHCPFVERVSDGNNNKIMKTMKNMITKLCAAILVASAITLSAGEPQQEKKHSAEFERLKTLVGTWKGKTDMGQGPVDMTIQYRLLAGGSVLEERVFAGTPNEMITMFYDKDGTLALTHYCVMGNRPGMLLKSSDAKSPRFEFDKTCGIDPLTETHMNAMTLTFNDADTITASLGDGTPLDPVKPAIIARF